MEERRLLTTIDLGALVAGQGTTLFGADVGDYSGYSVSSAGDVNGDGFDDLVIGAPGADSSGNAKYSAGESYVIFGAASPPATIDLANLGSAGITLFGADAFDQSGRSVSSAGDVNGDGFDDLVIGAWRADALGNNNGVAGESYLIFGAASLPTTIDLANLGSAGITFFGADAADRSGSSVSSAGDVNGDGFDDLIIGATGGDALGNGKFYAGESYVIFGAASLPATIDLANLSSAGITLFGADVGDNVGGSVSSAGDVNGDGFDDLVIGVKDADGAENAKRYAGESYVIFGAASLPATMDLANLGSAGITLFGADADDFSGGSVSSAGDVNGDGFDDLIIGATGGDGVGNAKIYAGESYVIFGAASLPATIDLANLSSAGITLFGADQFDRSGCSVSSAGDVNGDGFDDLVIAAARADDVIFGAASLPATIDLANLGSAGITLFGADSVNGHSVSSTGDVNGDGFDDLVIGAHRVGGLANANRYAGESYVIFGGNFTTSEPEIDVAFGDVSIADGDDSPSSAEGTDFGLVAQDAAGISRTFAIRNVGDAVLTLSGLSVPAGFTIAEELSGSLAPGASDTFTVRLDTDIVGTKSGQISFITNDSDENSFNFSVSGQVVTETSPTLMVTNTNDSGAGSLRQALLDANSNASADSIAFDISGAGPHTIRPLTPLPEIIHPLVIDGWSEPDFFGTPMVVLDGSDAGADGLVVVTDNSVIRGLTITNFAANGVVIFGGNHNVVQGNFIGTNASGTAAVGNGQHGILVHGGSTHNLLGTNGDGVNDSAEGNLVSGNGFDGVVIVGAGADDNIVAGNLIGTDWSGASALGGNHYGVSIVGGAKRNLVGTDGDGIADLAERNVISGNLWDGVLIRDEGTENNIVAGNLIGLNAVGTDALANDFGVRIDRGAKMNRIGTNGDGAGDAAERNTISGNRNDGVLIIDSGTSANVVAGNFIGTNAAGSAKIANQFSGIALGSGAHSNWIGTNADGTGDAVEGNLVSGNAWEGIALFDAGTSNNVVAGNLVGTDVTGNLGIGNGNHGILIRDGASANVIGGTSSLAGNVISGNNLSGIQFRAASENVVHGNYVGTTADGTEALGNGRDGIAFEAASAGNVVGGTSLGAGNRIAHSGNAGIVVLESRENVLSGNAMYANGTIDIDLSGDGVTPNDPGDADDGPNALQNFPVLDALTLSDEQIHVSGVLNSLVQTTYRVEFFAYWGTGVSETSEYLGFVEATTDAAGNASFTRSFAAETLGGKRIRATATDASGNTSELSVPVEVVAPNLSITDIFLRNGNGQRIDAPAIGERIAVQVDYTTSELPAGAEYRIDFIVGGVLLDSGTISAGSGLRSGTWSSQQSGWYASPGSHEVEVTLDALEQVAESTESDNTGRLTFEPVAPTTLPSRFHPPLGGNPDVDWTIVNYIDVDPVPGQSADFRGGHFQYDGHNATDFVLANFESMDAGVPVFAAAAGVVSAVEDGHFDRQTGASGEPVNYVVIDHGNGWATEYLHLAANSIVVAPGQSVAAGEVLGLVGSSGNSTDAHLHFTVLHNGHPVETNYASGDYWHTPLPYQGDNSPAALDYGITNAPPWNDFKERPNPIRVFPTWAAADVWFWLRLSQLRDDDQVRVQWYRPSGEMETEYSYDPPGEIRYGRLAWKLPAARWSAHPGNWQAVFTVGGSEIARTSFWVTDGAGVPEVDVLQAGVRLVDGRTTAVDFGAVVAGASPVQESFTIENRGTAPLIVSDFQLPSGFSMQGSVPTEIAAGGSGTFTVQLDSHRAGLKFGQIAFRTNDPDERQFAFRLRGEVSGDLPLAAPTIGLPGPATAFRTGGSEVLLNPEATLTDTDSANFAGGLLLAEFVTGGSPTDVLAIRHQGGGTGQIGVDGMLVRYDGIVVGASQGGRDGEPLQVTLNSNATPQAVEALLRNLTFFNDLRAPAATPRTVRLLISDDQGNISNEVTQAVIVAPTGTARPPVVSRVLDQVTMEDIDVGPLSFTVDDAVTFAADLDFEVRSTNHALVAPGDVVVGGSGHNRYLTIPSRVNQFGTAMVTISAINADDVASSRSFMFRVNPVNDPPALAPIGDRSVDEGNLLTFTASASDSDAPENTLRFSLDAGAPAGASIDPITGVFTWTPSEAQGPGMFDVTVRVTDNGAPALADFETIEVTVGEVNESPVLAAIGDKSVDEGSLLTFTASASDPDTPANTLRFSLDPGAPAGASINPITGVFTWTPSEAQGPGTSDVTVRVRDDGSPAQHRSLVFSVHVIDAAPWQNHVEPTDVNADGVVLPYDALLVINHLNFLNRQRSGQVASAEPQVGEPQYVDVDGNGTVEPLDALLVINRLRAISRHNASTDTPNGESSPDQKLEYESIFGHGVAMRDGWEPLAPLSGSRSNKTEAVQTISQRTEHQVTPIRRATTVEEFQTANLQGGLDVELVLKMIGEDVANARLAPRVGYHWPSVMHDFKSR